jgi:hypothetical protein
MTKLHFAIHITTKPKNDLLYNLKNRISLKDEMLNLSFYMTYSIDDTYIM